MKKMAAVAAIAPSIETTDAQWRMEAQRVIMKIMVLQGVLLEAVSRLKKVHMIVKFIGRECVFIHK